MSIIIKQLNGKVGRSRHTDQKELYQTFIL